MIFRIAIKAFSVPTFTGLDPDSIKDSNANLVVQLKIYCPPGWKCASSDD